MDAKKPYLVVLLVNAIYAGMYLLTEAAFDGGMNTFVFLFYRQAFATVFLVFIAVFLERKTAAPLSFMILFKIFMLALIGITFSVNLNNIGLKYTSATVASAISNSVPVITFILAVLLRMETLKLKTFPGAAKLLGVSLCFGGIMIIAFYTGPSLHPRAFHLNVFTQGSSSLGSHAGSNSKVDWIRGTFLLILSNVLWALWIVLQAKVIPEYPSKLLFTTFHCVFSTIQSFCMGVALERDFSKWKLSFDIGLLAVLYSGIIVTGISFYLQAWCIEKKGPVFLAISMPLALVLTILGSTVLGKPVILGSLLGGLVMIIGLYSVMWGKRKEEKDQVKLPVIHSNGSAQSPQFVLNDRHDSYSDANK